VQAYKIQLHLNFNFTLMKSTIWIKDKLTATNKELEWLDSVIKDFDDNKMNNSYVVSRSGKIIYGFTWACYLHSLTAKKRILEEILSN